MITSVLVWDLPLRLSHWSLAIVLVASYVTGREGGLLLEWHAWLGLLVMAIVVFRIVWGFFGSTYSRFYSFIPTRKRWRRFLSTDSYGPGHSPPGAISVLLLLSVTLVQALTGLFTSEEDSEFAAPMAVLAGRAWSDRITEWHVFNVQVLLFLVAVHFTAICFYFFIRRKNLIVPMITGKEVVTCRSNAKSTQGGGTVQLMLTVAVAVLSVALVLKVGDASLAGF